MMAQNRNNGRQAFELPSRQPARREPGIRTRPQQAQVKRARSVQPTQPAAMQPGRPAAGTGIRVQNRRYLMIGAALLASVFVMAGVLIYQSSALSAYSKTISGLKEEIYELTVSAEPYETRLAQAASDEYISEGAARLGMIYPADDQIRTVNPD